MWDNDYKELSRKASGAWGRITCLQQPWESSLKPPFEQTAQPVVRACRAQGCSLPPDTVKALEANMNRRTGLQNQPLGTSRKGTALGSISQEHVLPCISSKLCHRCKILSLRRRNCQLKQEIHPTSLCRPHKCWFDSFTSFHKPIVAAPSFWQEDFRTDESF